VGISYSAWFVYRYVLKEDTRKELGEGFNSLKEQVLGKKS
jgi:CAAD domains of cyanobacterial aminoacyl-tRNA synthetase